MARSTFTLLAASAVTVLALSGCSVGAPDAANTPSAAPSESSSDQSTAESCLILQDAVKDSAAELQSAYAELQSDPAAAVAKIQGLADALDAGAAEITDADVKAAAEDARDSVTAMVDILEVVVADPASLDMTAFQTSATAVQDSFAAIGELCA